MMDKEVIGAWEWVDEAATMDRPNALLLRASVREGEGYAPVCDGWVDGQPVGLRPRPLCSDDVDDDEEDDDFDYFDEDDDFDDDFDDDLDDDDDDLVSDDEEDDL